MPNPRTQVEAVLDKYGIISVRYGQNWPDFITDLCALLALPGRGPDRAALETILIKDTVHSFVNHEGLGSPHHRDFNVNCPICQALIRRLMAWAQGGAGPSEPAVPVWCDHMERVTPTTYPGSERWWKFPSAGYVNSSKWKVCPICAAPRPSGEG